MTKENEKTTRDKFNQLKKYYDETWDDTGHTLHVGLFKKETDSLSKAYDQATNYLIKNVNAVLPISKDSVVLDVGCGTGRTIIETCAEYGCRGTGVDLSDEQINDARIYLKKINTDRVLNGLPRIRVRFTRGSGSELNELFKKNELFTHVISQDAILLVSDKHSLFENIQRLLVPGGVFAAADFLSESKTNDMSESERNLVYKLVNWNESLSFEMYEKILKTVGLNIIKAERRDLDMIQTYDKLARRMEKYASQKDKVYGELGARYKAIVSSVKEGKMGWGFFLAQKPPKKTVLLAGTKKKSIARFLAKALHAEGWEVWLYSRHATKIDGRNWHERKCDISDEKSIKKLLTEISQLDLAVMLADTGGHNVLEETSEKNAKDFVNSKIIGSVLLTKALMSTFSRRFSPIKIIWCAGSTSKKPRDLIMYAIANSGITSFVNELNIHYKDVVEAHYLTLGPISPSTLGDEYINLKGQEIANMAKHPQAVLDEVKKIIY